MRIAQDSLPVPLALENIAALIAWPGEELTEGQFLAELVQRTGVRLLIDVANLHTNHVNRGEDPAKALDELPVEAIAYVHVAGGIEKDGVWHDTHAHPLARPVLDVLAELRSRIAPPGVLLERDDDFPPAEELTGELTAVRATLEAAGKARSRSTSEAGAHGDGGVTPGASPVEPAEDTTTAGTSTSATGTGVATDGARDRAAVAQTALLSALVAGTPAPEGFDHRRLGIQSRALAAKRADVVAKVAPELPGILGDGYRDAFLAYARTRPMSAGYRRDALDFAEQLLITGRPSDDAARRRLTHWWQDRAAARPPRRTTRLVRAARAAIAGR